METLSKVAVLHILSLLDEALQSIPANEPDWANPGWAIRMARNRLLETAISDIRVETIKQEEVV